MTIRSSAKQWQKHSAMAPSTSLCVAAVLTLGHSAMAVAHAPHEDIVTTPLATSLPLPKSRSARSLEMFGGKSTMRESMEDESHNAVPEECLDDNRRQLSANAPKTESDWYSAWKLRVQCWMLDASNGLGLQNCANALSMRMAREFEGELVKEGRHGPMMVDHPHDAIPEAGCEWVSSISIPSFPAFGDFDFKMPSVRNLAPWTPWGLKMWREMTVKQFNGNDRNQRLPTATFGREKEYTGNIYTIKEVLGPDGKLPEEFQRQGVEIVVPHSNRQQQDQHQLQMSATPPSSVPVAAAGAGIGFALGSALSLVLFRRRDGEARGRWSARKAAAVQPGAAPTQ